MSIEYYIGLHEFSGKKVVCRERLKYRDDCEQCFFYEDKLCKELICTKERRTDKRDVIFKELSEKEIRAWTLC